MKITSKIALEKLETSGKAGIQRAKILKFLLDNPRVEGYTRQELCKKLNITVNAMSGRCATLLKTELIESKLKRNCGITKSYVEALFSK